MIEEASKAKQVSVVDSSSGTLERKRTPKVSAELTIGLWWCLLVALCAALSISQQNPAQVVPAGASPELFSAGAAMRHVAAIAEKPHPMGSVQHHVVRDYIMKELAAAGVEPEIHRTIAVKPIPRRDSVTPAFKFY